ncbi:restriction endonuclease subunit S [Vibrio sp. 10N.286.54.B2]|uniref:restriction endonuclease subunit S n=1 Tax=Vibrio sp. 10N.286.54.B2 TaxID=3229718 RepID=UPI0035537AE7
MTEQMKVPKLRFGEFTAGHIDTTLEALTKKKISYGIVQAGPHIPDGMPYIKSTNLNTELCLDNLERTSDEIAKSYQRSEVSPEDIVFSLRGNIGLTRIVPASIPVANLTQGTARLSIKDSFSNVYVNYCLSTRKVYKRVNSVSKGSTFKEISLADLRNVKITHSSDLEEQQKIASFLSKVDEKIGLLSEKKNKLTEYKRGVMQQLFNGKWHEQGGQLTFVPPTLRFKADDGSEFPDWEEKKLGEVCEFRDSQRLPLSSEERQQRQGQYRYFGASGVIDYVDDFLFDGDFVLLGEDGANIITRSTPLAFVVKGKFWVNNHAHVLKALGSTYFLAQSLELLNYEKYNSGTAQPKLNAAICKKIELIMPCDAEQTKIANFLSAIDQKIDLTNSELNKAKEWKKGLLQQMFV